MALKVFGKVDKRVMQDARLCPTAKAIYAYFTCYADNVTGKCYPSISTIAGDLQISDRTVSRHISELVALRVIDRIPTQRMWATITQINHSEYLPPYADALAS
ncbi:helix-turn-helix domain-containing protein [uncultured Mucilaginibacter sp.]|uniref:helix-turn-helix domain-containing protein n=1 Tax=uncultured Mucilaginibacter sp. TaxID=797541 RepID=UPI00345C40F9